MVNSVEGSWSYGLDDHRNGIAELELHDGVPEEIRIHFETTKNIYLYSWFVYRFFPVSQHYSLVTLEFALRNRFEAEIIASGDKKRNHGPGLEKLLRHAIGSGHLRNESFLDWRRRTEMRARQRTSYEVIEKMMRENIEEMEYDENKFVITDQDRDHDILQFLLKNLPALRNHFAHGTRTLDNHALGTIRMVSEIINQIFPSTNKEAKSHSE